MEVKQLIGRLAGQVIDMPYAEATACIAAGTACLPDEEPTNIRGLGQEVTAASDADQPIENEPVTDDARQDRNGGPKQRPSKRKT